MQLSAARHERPPECVGLKWCILSGFALYLHPAKTHTPSHSFFPPFGLFSAVKREICPHGKSAPHRLTLLIPENWLQQVVALQAGMERPSAPTPAPPYPQEINASTAHAFEPYQAPPPLQEAAVPGAPFLALAQQQQQQQQQQAELPVPAPAGSAFRKWTGSGDVEADSVALGVKAEAPSFAIQPLVIVSTAAAVDTAAAVPGNGYTPAAPYIA